MANRIPRTAKRLEVTWLVGSNACPAGTTTEVYKDEFGWHEEVNGKFYSVFASMLRNENICTFKVLEA